MKKLSLLFVVLLFTSLSIFAQAPTVTITTDNPNMSYGGSGYIYWTSTNAKTCNTSGGTNGWAELKIETSGSFYTGNLYSNTTYNISASNDGNIIALGSVTIVVSTPQINIYGRAVGVGTFIEVPVTVNGNGILEIFKLKTIRRENSLMPHNFYLGEIFYQGQANNWISPPADYSWSELNFSAVGNTIYFYDGAELGTLKIFVEGGINNEQFISNTRLYDTHSYWSTGFSSFKLINLPKDKYGNLTGDRLKDSHIMFGLLGITPLNDTTAVAYNLSGTAGPLKSYDIYLNLTIANNEENINYIPLFQNGGGPYGSVSSAPPITLEWKKISATKYGLFSTEKITNADFTFKNSAAKISTVGSTMYKQIGKNGYLINMDPNVNLPIATSPYPENFSGIANNGRKIIVSSVVTGVEEATNEIPTEFVLAQNYPNPFNPTTTIKFAIPEASFVNLTVYNLLGQEITTLVNETKSAGNYSIEFNAGKIASGTYIYKISANGFTQVKKMILMK